MTKISFLVFVVSFSVLGFSHLAESVDEAELLRQDHGLADDLDDENGERSGAQGIASASVRPRPLPGPTPRPVGPIPVSPIGRLVECYVCTDCPKVLRNTTTKLCPMTLDNTKQMSCVTYAEKYKHMKRPWYIRGCASERGLCSDIRQAHSGHAEIVKLLFCDECQGDRCNTSGAYRSLSDVTMAFFALIVTPLVAKYTLS